MSRWIGAGLAGTAAVAGYVGVVTGAVAVDLGVGRSFRPLGPLKIEIAAPRKLVFDVTAAPYLQRQPRAVADKIHVLERATDMVLAAHRTPVRGRLVATTVETVRFTKPERVDFRLVRGPVPHVVESFVLTDSGDGDGTVLEYTGTLGTDLWRSGRIWGDVVAARWEQTVAASLETIKAEAERRATSVS